MGRVLPQPLSMGLSLIWSPEGLVLVIQGEGLLAEVPAELEGEALGKDWKTLGSRVLAQTLTSCVTLDKSLGVLRAQFPQLKTSGWRSCLQKMHCSSTCGDFQPRFLGPAQNCQELDLGVGGGLCV